MKKRNRLIFNISIMAIAFMYVLVLVLTNVGVVKSSIAYESGSYAEQYAKKKHLNTYELSDSQTGYFELHYEQFDYDINDGEVTIQGYNGLTSDLVIPAFIDGLLVTTIGENFFNNSPNVKSLYLPDLTKKIEAEVVDDITIYCNTDCIFYRNEETRREEYETKIAETESSQNKEVEMPEEEFFWNISISCDSDYANFFLDEIDFTYNETVSTIDITGYTGNDDLVVIPAYINGKPVTTVSMDLLGLSAVVIPGTVTDITGKSVQAIYSSIFAVELIFTMIAFTLTVIIINIVMPRNRAAEEYFLSAPQMFVSYLYVIIQAVFSILAIYKGVVGTTLASIISAAILAAYVLLISLVSAGKNQAKMVDQHIEQKTARMKEIKLSGKRLADNILDANVKKQVERFVEDLQHSDPSGVLASATIEDELALKIGELKDVISSGKTENILVMLSEVNRLLETRNDIVKNSK